MTLPCQCPCESQRRSPQQQAFGFPSTTDPERKLSRKFILIEEIPQNYFLLSLKPKTSIKAGNYNHFQGFLASLLLLVFSF